MTSVASYRTGQLAVPPLPSPAAVAQSRRSHVHTKAPHPYTLPDEILCRDPADFASSRSTAGLDVWKLQKHAKWSARRLGILTNRQAVVITSDKMKKKKQWWSSFTGGSKNNHTQSTHDGLRLIRFAHMDRIQRGANTKRFAQLSLQLQQQQQQQQSDDGESSQQQNHHDDDANAWQQQSLSIVYWNHAVDAMETLDIMVPSLQDYETILHALEDLVVRSHQDVVHNSTIWTQHVHQHCHGDTVSLTQWLDMTRGCPWGKARLTEVFKKQPLLQASSSAQATLTVPQTSELLCLVHRECLSPTVLQLWEQLVTTDPVPLHTNNPHYQKATISPVAFLSFLRDFQQHVAWQLEDAVDLIRILPLNNYQKRSHTTSDRLSQAQFWHYLLCGGNDILAVSSSGNNVQQQPPQDMTKPLSHYWIQSAHHPIVSISSTSTKTTFGGQTANRPTVVADEQMITAALLRGVRCLQLKVESYKGEIVATTSSSITINNNSTNSSNAATTTTTTVHRVPLRLILQIIVHFLQNHPYTFPIILQLENHAVQARELVGLADMLQSVAGDYLLGPSKPLHHHPMPLPSPDRARGKLIICGKRVDSATANSNDNFVVMDDYEENLTEPMTSTGISYRSSLATRPDMASSQRVVGFDTQGPVYAAPGMQHHKLSAGELLQHYHDQAAEADVVLREAQKVQDDLEERALEQENVAADLTLRAGLLPDQVRRKALPRHGRDIDLSSSSLDVQQTSAVFQRYEEEKNSKAEEGVEIHEILPGVIQGRKSRYEVAAQQALEATQWVDTCRKHLEKMKRELVKAQGKRPSAEPPENDIHEQARKAANEARMHNEHAQSAKERLNKVKELVTQVQDKSSSAGTVVQTALTEAKISEKRAVEAEARHQRAQATADKEKKRAEDETRKEEILENAVTELHRACQAAQDKYDQIQERKDKATVGWERTKEQIRSLENSSKYREQLQRPSTEIRPLVTQHSDKIKEREKFAALIDQANKESKVADKERKQNQSQLESKAREWRVQAELASQTRRNADRSAHMAEELAEHAEEEREAAQLRHVAHQRAEATVNDRGSQEDSVMAQLAQAEKAAAQAAKLAVQSKNRAEDLARQASKVKPKNRSKNGKSNLEQIRFAVLQAEGELESALLLKKKKDERMDDEKQRLDVDSELCKSAVISAVSKGQVQVDSKYEQEAIEAYRNAVSLRQAAEEAKREAVAAATDSSTKHLISKRARDYKDFLEMTVDYPFQLSELTLLHSCRLKDWNHSVQLSHVHVHALSHTVLRQQLDRNPDETAQLHSFSKNHLCRIFPTQHEHESPVLPWALGCQLVGMNLACPDEHLMVAEGRFRQNGSCGYALKPRSLTHNDSSRNRSEQPQRWAFQVLCGFGLPDQGSPRVEVRVWTGYHNDHINVVHTTSDAMSNTFSPVWNDPAFDLKIENPAMAMVSVLVYSGGQENEFIAGAALPVQCWREGFRSIALFDAHHNRLGQYKYASLLVRVTKVR